MAWRGRFPARATLTLAAFVVAIAAMTWFLRNRGAGADAQDQPMVEECGFVLSGSSTIGLRLAPALVGDFLRAGGYSVAEPVQEPDGVTQIVGARQRFQCTVTVRALESTTGFEDLASGEALVGLSSRPVLPADIEALRAAGAGDFEAERALAEHVFAYDAVAIVANAANPAREFSLDQARAVTLGITRNWIDLGGESEEVRVYAPLEQAGRDDFPNDLVQSRDSAWIRAQERLGVRVLRDDPAVIEAVANDRFGLGFVSASFPRDPARVRDLRLSAGGGATSPSAAAVRAQAYPLARRLFLYVRPADMRGNAFAQRFVAYAVSSDAFERIETLGFVALRPDATADASAVRAIGCRMGAPESAALASALRGAEREPTLLRFRENTTDLNERAHADVARLAPGLIARIARGEEVLLVGHSDIAGRAEDNRTLALERALAARAAFEALGVYGLLVESAGEMCPTADTETASGRRNNRRVEIWVRPRPGAGGR